MPSATIDSHGVAGVAAAAAFLDQLLERAESIKKTASIEPPLEKSNFDDLRRQLNDALGYDTAEEAVDTKKIQRFAVIETAVRDTFKSLIVSWPSVCAAQPSLRLIDYSPGNNTH
jgi:THO complex subunit 1